MKPDRLNSEPEVDILKHRCDMEVKESARAEEHLGWETRVDASRAVLHKVLTSPSTSIEEVAKIILSRAQKLTGSQHGFVASLDPHVGSLIGYASTRMLESEYPMQGPNAKFVLSRGSDGHYPGLWGVSLNSGQAFYSNTPASHPASTGIPDGHVPLERFLSLPVLIGSLVVGLIALSNAEKDYSDQDLAAIQPLAETLALVIQRSRYETALQKSDAFNRSIIDNSTDCIHVMDLEGRLQYMSQGGQEQMGIMDIAPYLTSPYENFWKNEDRQGVREAINKARQGETGTFQGFCPTLEGVPKWWEVVISPIRDHSGETEKLLVVSRDISERKRLEEALQEADRFNRAAIDALSAHLAILDENGFILTVNQAWRDFAQTNAGETTHLCEGINYLAICDAVKGKESQEAFLFAAGMRAVLEGKQDEFALEYPCHALHKKRWFMGRVTHFKSKGMIYLVIAHEDITESKQADEALLQSHAQLEQRVEERTAQLVHAKQRMEDKITELEQSQDNLRDLAARYRIVADNTYDWEFWLDSDGQFLYSSPSCQRITGYGAEDFLRDPTLLDQMVHPDDWAIWLGHFAETAVEKTVKQIEFRIIHKDGSICWIEHVCQPVFDEQGQYLGIRGSNRDISQRKQAEESLSKSERRFQQMVESITTYIYTVKVKADRSLSTLCGPGCLGLTGYSADEFASDADLWLQMVHPQDQALVTHQADRVLAGMTVLPLEHRMVRKDGSICWVKNIPIAQFNEMGDLVGYDGIVTDISERKLAQQALIESYQFNREIIAGAGEGIFALDSQLNYVLWNPTMEKLTGLVEKDMLGKKVLDISPALKDQDFYHLLERGLVGETVISPDFRFHIPQTGKSGWLSGTCTPLHDNGGNIVGVIVVLRDINERKQAEEAFRKLNQQDEEALRIAHMGHWELDLATTQFTFNDQYYLLHGITAEQAGGYIMSAEKFVSRYVHPDDAYMVGKAIEAIRRIIETNDPNLELQQEARILRADGESRVVMLWFRGEEDTQGRITRIRGVSQDITEHKRADDKLKTILRTTIDSFYLIDMEGRILDTNDSYCALIGYSRAELLTMQIKDIEAVDTDEEIQKRIEEILKTGHTRFETRHKTKDGRIIEIEASVNYLTQDQPRFFCFMRDITERKQAEDDIRKQSERAEALLHVAARLNAQLDLSTLLRTICEETTAMLHAPAAWISLYEPEQNTLCYAGDYGMPPEFKQGYKAIPRAVFAKDFAREGVPILVVPDMQLLTGIPNWALYTALNIRTLAIASITRDGQLIGGLCVISSIEERTFNADEQDLLRGLANLAAQAIENARLFTHTQRHLNLQRTLHLIDLTITSEDQVEPSLKIILPLVAGQLCVDAARVLLLNPQSEAFDDIASYGLTANQPKLHLEKGENCVTSILLDGNPIHIPNLAQAENWVPPILLDLKKVVCYYGTPLIVKDKVIGVLELFNASPFNPDIEWIRTVEALATQTAIAIDHATLFHDLKQTNLELSQAYDTTLEGWSHAMDLRDKETEGHTLRVTAMSVRLAGVMGLRKAELLSMRRGALLHDMGKMGIPDAILLKPGPLTDAEWIIMRKHPADAYDMLSPINYLHSALDIPYCHHEKWDGSGYPRGMKGEEIPLAARIFAIADVWDALTSNRPYRSAWSTGRTRQYIQELSGSHFEPRVVTTFLEMLDGFLENRAAMALPEPA